MNDPTKGGTVAVHSSEITPEIRAYIEDRQAACDMQVWEVIEAFSWDGGLTANEVFEGLGGAYHEYLDHKGRHCTAGSEWTEMQISRSLGRLERFGNITTYDLVETRETGGTTTTTMHVATTPPREVEA